MQHHLLWLVFVGYFSFINKCECIRPLPDNDIPYIMTRLFENRHKPPIILYLEPKQYVRNAEEEREDSSDIQYDIDREDDSDENILRTTQSDERAYVLYHLLRTTIDEEDIDPARVQKLEHTKEFLREAFIGRCRKLKKCLRQCPEPKPKKSCNVQCKQIFDDLDECNEPKQNKCEEPKCGHTMPPSWLL